MQHRFYGGKHISLSIWVIGCDRWWVKNWALSQELSTICTIFLLFYLCIPILFLFLLSFSVTLGGLRIQKTIQLHDWSQTDCFVLSAILQVKPEECSNSVGSSDRNACVFFVNLLLSNRSVSFKMSFKLEGWSDPWLRPQKLHWVMVNNGLALLD